MKTWCHVSQEEMEKSRLFNQQVKQLNAALHDLDYTQRAGTAHLTALLAQEEQRAMRSGPAGFARVNARDAQRAITPEVTQSAIPVIPICWSCHNPLKKAEIDSSGRVVACQKCTNAHEAAQTEREDACVRAREERYERDQAEHEEWRVEQYERHLQEQAELEARKGERYETGSLSLTCESIQGSFGLEYLCNPVLHEYFALGGRALVPLVGDLILESGYKKEQVDGCGYVYWLLVENSIIVIEVWEERLFPAVIEKVEVR